MSRASAASLCGGIGGKPLTLTHTTIHIVPSLETLAGAFAFLVAVALFRMGNIDSEMERVINEVIPYAASAHDQGFLSMKARSHEWSDVERYISQERIDAIPGDALKSAVATKIREYLQKRAEKRCQR